MTMYAENTTQCRRYTLFHEIEDFTSTIGLTVSLCVCCEGVPGGNIPADLFNEHLNRLCKEEFRSLCSKTKEGIVRVGKALGIISPILRKFDDDNCVPLPSGKHASISAERDRSIIINELIKYQVLKNQDGRSIRGLVKPKSLMKKGLQKDLLEWIGTKTEQYYDS